MERLVVSSSNIVSIGYNASHMVLEVEFKNGAIYQYNNVPQHLYDGLIVADSHGKFLDLYIKKAGYPCIRVL